MKTLQKWRAFLLLLALLFAAAPARAQDDPRGWLLVPDIWLSTSIDPLPIVDRVYDMAAIGQGVGHLEGTAWVTDGWARIVLAAHSTGAFARLNELEVGAWVFVADYPHSTVLEGYRVTLITVTAPDDVRWLQPTERETLTLITCASDETRLIIHAERAW